MLGISFGELFIILGATAALVGPKDLPVIARAAGRLAGKAIGNVQKARGQFDTILQQSQATQIHKELQDTYAQLEAIRYEIRSLSLLNPGPYTRRLDDPKPPLNNGPGVAEKPVGEYRPEDFISMGTIPSNLHSQAMAYAKLAQAPAVRSGFYKGNGDGDKLGKDNGLLNVLPISAESSGLLPKHIDEAKGSDIVLEAILEADLAHKAKHFFSQPQNQLPNE